MSAIRPNWYQIPKQFKYYTVLNGQIRLFESEPRVKVIETTEGKESIYVCDSTQLPYGQFVGKVTAEDCVEKRPVTSRTLRYVVSDLKTREKRGYAKYGTTVDRVDLGLEEWLQHLYEELLDASMYIKRLQFFQMFTSSEYQKMLELYDHLPVRFTRSEASSRANDLKIDPTIAGRLLKNEQLFSSEGVWYRKREL